MYATLAQLKAQLGIPGADTDRDDQLTAVLQAVTTAIDNTTERTFAAATGTATTRTLAPLGRTVDTMLGTALLTGDIGSPTGLAAAVGSAGSDTWTALPTSALDLWPIGEIGAGWPATGLLLLSGSWSTSTTGRVQVSADWGWPATPAAVEQACLIQAARIFKRKDSPEGILGSAEWGAVRVSRVDPDVDAMLAPYRVETALVG